jgi:hypothetical protein
MRTNYTRLERYLIFNYAEEYCRKHNIDVGIIVIAQERSNRFQVMFQDRKQQYPKEFMERTEVDFLKEANEWVWHDKRFRRYIARRVEGRGGNNLR